MFAIGFTTGQEVEWLPRATGLLRNELATIEIRVSIDHSATLLEELAQGRLDVAFVRSEPMPNIEFKVVRAGYDKYRREFAKLTDRAGMEWRVVGAGFRVSLNHGLSSSKDNSNRF